MWGFEVAYTLSGDHECPANPLAAVPSSRGGIVNEADLVVALDEGLISGAGIDCVLGEPPPADSPIHRIKGRRNVIVTPHVAWASQSARTTLWLPLIDCLESFVAGRPKSDVTGAVA